MKANFTYQRVGNQAVDLAMQQVSSAFARVDQTASPVVVQVNSASYTAVGNEDLIVVNRSGRVTLPTPNGSGWTVTIVQGALAQTVSITTASPSVPLDGDTPGAVTLSKPFDSARVVTDGAVYYVVGGSAAAPVIPPIPPFPPVVPPGPPPGPTPTPAASMQYPFSFGVQNTLNSTTDGVEHVGQQYQFPGDQLPGGLLALVGAVQGTSTSGTGTLRIYVGGTDSAVDGTLVAAFAASTTGFTQSEQAVFFTNPGILTYIKVTTQSAGAGQKTTFKNGNATIR